MHPCFDGVVPAVRPNTCMCQRKWHFGLGEYSCRARVMSQVRLVCIYSKRLLIDEALVEGLYISTHPRYQSIHTSRFEI